MVNVNLANLNLLFFQKATCMTTISSNTIPKLQQHINIPKPIIFPKVITYSSKDRIFRRPAKIHSPELTSVPVPDRSKSHFKRASIKRHISDNDISTSYPSYEFIDNQGIRNETLKRFYSYDNIRSDNRNYKK